MSENLDANTAAATIRAGIDTTWSAEQRVEAHAALDRLVALLADTERERDAQMQSKLDAQVTLKAVTDALDLRFADLGDGWREAAPKVLARIETIVDEGERSFRERDEARARAERAEQQLAELAAGESVCAECNGRGEVAATPGQHGDGPMECPECRGQGHKTAILCPCACAVRRQQTMYLYDQWGIRISACEKTEPHHWHGWIAGNEDLRCPGVRGTPLALAAGETIPESKEPNG